MSEPRYSIKGETLDNIAEAIRNRRRINEKLYPSQFSDKINNTLVCSLNGNTDNYDGSISDFNLYTMPINESEGKFIGMQLLENIETHFTSNKPYRQIVINNRFELLAHDKENWYIHDIDNNTKIKLILDDITSFDIHNFTKGKTMYEIYYHIGFTIYKINLLNGSYTKKKHELSGKIPKPDNAITWESPVFDGGILIEDENNFYFSVYHPRR